MYHVRIIKVGHTSIIKSELSIQMKAYIA